MRVLLSNPPARAPVVTPTVLINAARRILSARVTSGLFKVGQVVIKSEGNT